MKTKTFQKILYTIMIISIMIVPRAARQDNDYPGLCVDIVNGFKRVQPTDIYKYFEDRKLGKKDFDPNVYFQFLTHLKMKPGYILDWFSVNNLGNGVSLLYARKIDTGKIYSYWEYLNQFQASPEEYDGFTQPLQHSTEFLRYVEVDGTSQGYLEFLTLGLLGDKFLLIWHPEVWIKTVILCDIFRSYPPTVTIDETSVTIQILTYIPCMGTFYGTYTMDKQNPSEFTEQSKIPVAFPVKSCPVI